MKNSFFNALRSLMYFCFILSTLSILAFLMRVMKEWDDGSSLYHVQRTPLFNFEFLEKIQEFFKDFPLSILIFLISLLLGFLIKDFLKKHNY